MPLLVLSASALAVKMFGRCRDMAEAAARQRLEAEWLQEQARIKGGLPDIYLESFDYSICCTDEPLEVTFSYQYRAQEKGAGHRSKVQVKKGSTIEEFLEQVRKQLKGISTHCERNTSGLFAFVS